MPQACLIECRGKRGVPKFAVYGIIPLMKKAPADHTHTHDHDHDHTESPLIAPNSSIIVTIEAKAAQNAYDKTIASLAKKVKVPGFRQGKVPPKIAQEQLNPEYIIERALQLVLPQAYETAVKASNKKPISHPQFKAVSVDLGKPWEIEAQFAEYPTIEIKDYKKIVKDAKKVAETEWKEQDKKKTEEKPAPNDTRTPEQKHKEFVVQHMYSALVGTLKPQIPELLVKQEAQYDVDQLVRQLEMFNMKLEDFLARKQTTFEEFSSEITISALGRLQLMFVLAKIAEEEKLEVTEADIEKAIAENTDSEYVQKQKDNPEYRSYLKETISRQKVLDFLMSL